VFALISEVIRQVLHRIRRSSEFSEGSDERELILEESRAYQALMEVYYLQGSPVRILLTSLRSLNLAESAGSSPELSRCYASFAAIMGLVPWHREAVAYFKRAAESASRVDSFESIEWSSLCEGTYRAGIGEWREATQHFDQMLATSRKLGDSRSNANALQGHAMVEYFRGEFARSLQFSISFHTSALQISEKRFEAEAIRWKTLNLLALGTLDEVPACLDRLELLRSNQKSTNILNYADVYSLRASLHLRLREYREAFTAAREAAGRIIRTPNTTHELIIERSLVAEVYLALWERINSVELTPWTGDGSLLRELRDGVARACDGLRRLSRTFPVGSPVASLRSGQQSYLRGMAQEGFASCLKSVDAAKRLGMVHVVACAEFEIGRHLPVGNSARKNYLDRACSVFRRIHATYDLAQAEAAAEISLS
jgi:tetratricopeptide (TPR) repeat protein